jgi:hypothetical protein
MDQDLKDHLIEMESRLIGQIRDSESRMESRIGEQIRDSESKLFTEFWKWGRSSDQRIRRVEHSDATTAERLAAIEDRIFTLERKVAGSKE